MAELIDWRIRLQDALAARRRRRDGEAATRAELAAAREFGLSRRHANRLARLSTTDSGAEGAPANRGVIPMTEPIVADDEMRKAFQWHAVHAFIREHVPFSDRDLQWFSGALGVRGLTNDDMRRLADQAKVRALQWALDRKFQDQDDGDPAADVDDESEEG